MRKIRSTSMSAAGFEAAIRNLARNSPWWMTSLCVHAVAAFILLQVPYWVDHQEEASFVSASHRQKFELPEPIEEPEFKPPPTDTTRVDEKQLEPDAKDVLNTDDTSHPDLHMAPDEGLTTGPFEGDFKNTSIGPGGGAGGGPDGMGSSRRRRARPRTDLTETAVELGLLWLSLHQDLNGDGRWDCDGFMKHDAADDRCDGPGGALHDVGVTGLAVLAFLGANYTDRGKGRFARNVHAGLRYLMRAQDDDGCLGSRTGKAFLYNHAIGALALCEAYWMTRNPRYRKPAQDALTFICRARNPYLAWRYEPRGGENDTSITGWMVMALKAGRWAGLEIDPDAFEGARQWIDKVTDPEFGQVGYDSPGGGSARPEWLQEKFPAGKSRSMTAVGMLTRIFLGEDPARSEIVKKGARLCAELPPKWDPDDGSIDMYYWYYGTLAMFQVGARHWKTWNRALKQSVVRHQHGKGSGSRTGSWDPIGVWGADGGRVYSTATMVMCLEVYYRYGRVFGTTAR